MSKRTPVVVALTLLLAIVGFGLTWAQSVFPVRIDRVDVEVDEVTAAEGTSVAITATALYLPPRSSAPFACNESRHGWMYHQCTNESTLFSSLVLCVCQEVDNTGTYVWAQMHNDNQVCDMSIAGPC